EPALPPVPGRIHTTLFVGRDQEWLYILSLFERQSPPHLLMVLGEAGIGKTRLAEELAREMQSKAWNVAWSQAYSQESTIPYHLWTQILRTALDQGSWLRDAIRKQPLVFSPLAALLPELQSILPIPSMPGTEREPLRLWEAVHALLILLSNRHPLLL